MQAIVNGLLTSYDRTGKKGKTILLLHGWADSKETFDKLAHTLSSEYDVICLDFPGFGASEIPKNPWTLDDFAKFIDSFVDKLSLNLYGLLGHSNGGAIAIRAVSKDYVKTEKLILVGSAGIRNPKSLKNKSLKILAKPAKLAIKTTSKSIQEKIKSKLYGSIGSDYMVAEEMKDTFKNIVAADVLADASKILQPTILIYGSEDKATPVEYGKKFDKAIENSELSVVKESGHFVHHDQPEKVSNIIMSFLK